MSIGSIFTKKSPPYKVNQRQMLLLCRIVGRINSASLSAGRKLSTWAHCTHHIIHVLVFKSEDVEFVRKAMLTLSTTPGLVESVGTCGCAACWHIP